MSLVHLIGFGVAAILSLKIFHDQNKALKPSKRPKEEDEYDSKIVDGVIVSFYTRNVALFSSNSSKSSMTGIGNYKEQFRHWALVFIFPNTGKVMTYDANEEDGYLIWKCKNSAPEMENGSKFYHDIVRCRTSPKKLQEIARNININYKPYNMCFRNCQVWVESFAKELGCNVYEAIVAKFKSILEKEPFKALLLGVGHAVMNGTKKLSQ